MMTTVCLVFRRESRDTDLLSRRFREGISFPNFVERSILKLPLSKLCAVPFALQVEGEKKAKRLDIFETPVTVTPQQKISKTLNSSKIP